MYLPFRDPLKRHSKICLFNLRHLISINLLKYEFFNSIYPSKVKIEKASRFNWIASMGGVK